MPSFRIFTKLRHIHIRTRFHSAFHSSHSHSPDRSFDRCEFRGRFRRRTSLYRFFHPEAIGLLISQTNYACLFSNEVPLFSFPNHRPMSIFVDFRLFGSVDWSGGVFRREVDRRDRGAVGRALNLKIKFYDVSFFLSTK